MDNLRNDFVTLRALEPEDLDFLYHTENNPEFWEVSNTLVPYSKHVLKQYLANAHQDIYEAKQLRMVILDTETNQKIGLIDLFDFNPQHRRAGIGILILSNYQQRGYATQVLNILINYAFSTLNLHQLYANIPADNHNSVQLFKKLDFKQTGVRKDWVFVDKTFKDVFLYQLINNQ